MRIPKLSLYLIALALSACGGGGDSDSPSSEPQVSSNQSPSAAFSASPSSGNAPLIVALDASASSDPDGEISTYEWDLGDGQSGAGEVLSHTYTDAGSRIIRLTITDDRGATNSTTRTVVVSGGTTNQPPVAQISANQTSGPPPLTVSFDASGSSDPDGIISQFLWDFGDGTSGSGATISHTYTDPGTFTAQLDVTDDDGETSSTPATITIEVNAAPVTSSACLPAGDLPRDLNDFVSDDDTQLTFTVATPPTQGTLNLSADGTVLSYALNQGNGAFRGVDSFTYEVSDSSGGTATGSVNLIVGKTRIMPLGDSIAKGVTRTSCAGNSIPEAEQVGYRAKLFRDLEADGYLIDFVGTLSNGAGATPPIGDADHQGIDGEEASAVAANIEANLNLAPADIVLLHIGTNNINFDDPDVVNGDIQTILDNIDTWEGTNNPITVMLSTVIERSTEPLCDPNPIFPNANVAALNTRITNTVNSRQGTDDIVRVDQNNALNAAADISPDGVHPNEGGYDKMADRWFAELTDTSNSGEIVSLLETLRCPAGN